jgi:hypothetical protein
MPRRDGTGPAGQGPKTGRGTGNCTTPKKPISTNRNVGLGRGIGRGIGRRIINTEK